MLFFNSRKIILIATVMTVVLSLALPASARETPIRDDTETVSVLRWLADWVGELLPTFVSVPDGAERGHEKDGSEPPPQTQSQCTPASDANAALDPSGTPCPD